MFGSKFTEDSTRKMDKTGHKNMKQEQLDLLYITTLACFMRDGIKY